MVKHSAQWPKDIAKQLLELAKARKQLDKVFQDPANGE